MKDKLSKEIRKNSTEMNPVTRMKKELKTVLTGIFLLGMCAAYANNNIHGKEVVCENSMEVYSTLNDPNSTYNWSLNTGGTLLSNGTSEVTVLWDLGVPGGGPYDLFVTITDQGGTQVTHSLEVYFQGNISLSCDNTVNVSLGLNGEAVISPQALLNNTLNNFDNFVVEVTDAAGNSYGNLVDCNHIGEELTGKVTDLCSGSSCWSFLVIEDKTKPQFDCPSVPIELECHEDFENYSAPSVTDNCTDEDDILVVFLGQTIDDSNVCDEVFVTKQWIAIDDFGNEKECEQVIRITSPDVDFPPDTIWTCDDYAQFPSIADPSPFTASLSTTGSGIPLGVDGLYCAYNFNFTDDTLTACGNNIKILRTWFVFNWCTGDVVLEDSDGDTYEQLIEISDLSPPEISLDPLIVNAENKGSVGVLCYSTSFLPAPEVTDNCNDYTIKIFTPIGEVEYENGVDGSEGGYIPFPGLVIGNHFVTYQVTDVCGNVGEHQVLVQVKDIKEPNAICDFITDVNLTTDGEVEVFAETFDDGSYDNCCIDRFEVRRMEDPVSAFSESIIFNCNDDLELVVFRVFDCFGNFNECMVEVEVQDKLIPVCLAPADLTVSCLDIPVGLELTDSETLTELFGEANQFDNCGATITELTAIGNIYCGDGYLNRQFIATDNAGNQSATCLQHITIEGTSNWTIYFPADWIGECGSPDNSNEVIVENDGCDLFATSYTDQLFNVSSDSACTQILRTWEVVNWCDYLPNSSPLEVSRNVNGDSITHISHGNYAYFSYQQTIWITDGAAPVITYNGDTDFCTLDADCATGEVDIPVQIQDECTDDLHLTYKIDLNRDGSIEASGNGEFDGTIPLGDHRLFYNVIDGCGNESDLEIEFSVIDCKKPSPNCENGLIVEIMQTGMIEVWAEDFNANSYDNCPGDLKFSFSQDTTYTSHTFDCYDIGIQNVSIWVTDASGNQAFCNTTVLIQDNMWICQPIYDPIIAGVLETENGETLTNVEVSLSDGQNFMTADDGEFEFSTLTQGQDYSLSPFKDINPLNGVSTYDLVLISKHILATEPLNSPYKMIAADINRSGTITTFDLVALRKLILHIEDDFSNNTSWRFIEKAYQFQNPNNPFNEAFPETIDINNLDEDYLNADFIAVKIGDVNGNAQTNNLQSADDRNFDEQLFFKTENLKLLPDQTYQIDVRASDFNDMEGFQFTLDFDSQKATFGEVLSNGLCQKEHFGTRYIEDGLLTVSWHNTQSISLSDGDLLFSFILKSASETTLNEVLDINSNLTASEAYRTSSEVSDEVRFMNVQLDFENTLSDDAFVLYQNIPNPFQDKTLIGFNLPEASFGTLSILDVSGRLIWKLEQKFSKGRNDITVRKEDLQQSGILFYRLETPQFTGVKKMIIE